MRPSYQQQLRHCLPQSRVLCHSSHVLSPLSVVCISLLSVFMAGDGRYQLNF